MKMAHVIPTVLKGRIENLRRAIPAKDQLARFTISGTTVQVRLDDVAGSFDILSKATDSGEEVSVGVALVQDRNAELYWLLSRHGEIVPCPWHDRIRVELRSLLIWAGAGAVATPIAIMTTFRLIRAGTSTGWFVAAIVALIVTSLILAISTFHLARTLAGVRQRALSLQLERFLSQQRQARQSALCHEVGSHG
jgi:hypothetical protein